jgi:cytochrome c biogenesis protein ResB
VVVVVMVVVVVVMVMVMVVVMAVGEVVCVWVPQLSTQEAEVEGAHARTHARVKGKLQEMESVALKRGPFWEREREREREFGEGKSRRKDDGDVVMVMVMVTG